MQGNIVVEQVKTFSPQIAESIRKLTKQLDDQFEPLSDEEIEVMITSSCNHLFVARHSDSDLIIGMVTLILYRIPYTKKGIVEDLVVDTSFRGQGIAKKLISRVLKKAQEEEVYYVDLTSQPMRESANILYKQLGFEERNTNSYRLKLR